MMNIFSCQLQVVENLTKYCSVEKRQKIIHITIVICYKVNRRHQVKMIRRLITCHLPGILSTIIDKDSGFFLKRSL